MFSAQPDSTADTADLQQKGICFGNYGRNILLSGTSVSVLGIVPALPGHVPVIGSAVRFALPDFRLS